MQVGERSAAALSPSAYQGAVVDYLKRFEPEVWAWAARFDAQAQMQELRTTLLRETYRLTPESHAAVHAACAEAMRVLEIEAEATLYQAGSGEMNAALIYAPGQANLVFHGPVLERLDADELSALLGHELAHYRLWSLQDGDFHTAARVLDQTLGDPTASASHAETARLYGLHTELYADRGAALVAGTAGPAISTLVKVRTGLAQVDPAAYLIQADELERGGLGVSEGETHPEAYLRAQAVDRWTRGAPDLETWLDGRLHGSLAMARLDLIGQARLQALTRRFIARFLADPALRGERIVAQVRAYFPDWSEHEPAATPEEFSADLLADDVRDYLGYVLIDLALADPDLRHYAVVEAARAAHAMGRGEAFLAALRRDAGLSRREIDALNKRLKEKAA